MDAPVAPVGRVLLAQTWSEILIRWRLPAFSATSLALPVVLFSFFGLPFAGRSGPRGVDVGVFLLASFGAYAVGQVMVFGFGIGVAVERGQKVDLLMRATPLPPGVYLIAKVAVGMLFALLSVLVLFTYGGVIGGIRLAPGIWVSVIVRLLAGSLPLIALGFAIGYLAGPNAARRWPTSSTCRWPSPPASSCRTNSYRRSYSAWRPTCRRITTRSSPGVPSARAASR
jgi:ABC-2 type transport system permease protein